jgi:hypothetical protein
MRKLTALLLTVLLLFGAVGTAMARTNEQMSADWIYMGDQIKTLEQAGQYCNDETYSLLVDLTNISTTGTVTMSVYDAVYSAATMTSSFTTTPHDWQYAEQELVKYGLGNVANLYAAEPYNTDLTCKTELDNLQHLDVIPFYVHGPYKSQVIAELYNGIPKCFEIQYNPSGSSSSGSNSYSGSDSHSVAPIPMPVAESTVAADTGKTVTEVIKSIFALNNTSYIFNDKTETMDVAPYIKDSRTYIPVRYLAYSLGVTPENIAWNQANQTVTVSLGETTVAMTIGSNVLTVNGTTAIMAVAPEIVDNRTMLPARYLAEALGATVTWNPTTNSVEITRPGS